ncbi:MAG: hypothetical protein ACXWSD_13370 [Bdellovibrionota bacterium]
MGFQKNVFLALVLVALPISARASSGDNLPPCVDASSNSMNYNNGQVLKWKTTTQTGYLDRAFIKGTLVGVFDHGPDHLHVDVFLGQNGVKGQSGRANDLEVIYNQEFGAVDGSKLTPGMEVIACGDYITSNQPNHGYPASPLDAILHWVHKSNTDRHASGFLMIDGVMYGQADAPPRHWNNNHGGGNQQDGIVLDNTAN